MSFIFGFAQNITFISENSGMPLPKVMVFNIDGDLVTTSSNDGTIEKSSLNPCNLNTTWFTTISLLENSEVVILTRT
ncbi:hypothetical protein MTP09_13965 [Chryseobacterium suipulveris]|uniref:Uncharacterized protein n=1 Tax=Chryseobacterium suipulveris TaxID=2929800 RepID=A0ABY4BWT9_9FLAO|nr:hypothetical protein [Chryseobacterium suipulveris]UOE40990.1 hypothetical protein MTP09_13965 [Chryseobacterium suipulveris]